MFIEFICRNLQSQPNILNLFIFTETRLLMFWSFQKV